MFSDSKKHGFTITPPTVLVLLFMVLLLMLATTVIPTIRTYHLMGGQLVCQSNLKSISTAMSHYLFDYEKYPTSKDWCDLLIDKTNIHPEKFHCGFAKRKSFTFAMNKNLLGLNKKDVPDDTVMFFEIEDGKNVTGGPELLYTGRHKDKGCNVVFAYGNVEWISKNNFDKLKWTVKPKPGPSKNIDN
ncbi:MAG: hypothetical protein KAS23_01660 [Anaerohalosphaera sp.]|nr:hypothetical protein [Anaerohalosphaera sp.]